MSKQEQQQQAQVAQSGPPKPAKIQLPHDVNAAIFILAIGGHFIRDRIHTRDAYRIETLRSEVEGYNQTARDVGDAANRIVLLKKRYYKKIDNIPETGKLRLPRLSFPILGAIILGTAAFLVFYFQYSPQAYAQLVNVWNTSQNYIIAFVLLTFALLMFALFAKRRRRRATAQQ